MKEMVEGRDYVIIEGPYGNRVFIDIRPENRKDFRDKDTYTNTIIHTPKPIKLGVVINYKLFKTGRAKVTKILDITENGDGTYRNAVEIKMCKE